MPVQESKQTDQQKEQEVKTQEDKSSSVLDNLKNSSLMDGLVPPEEKVKETEEESVEEESVEQQEESSEEEVTDEGESSEEEVEEDLIPKSKVQARFDKLTSQLKQLELENATLKTATSQPKDVDEIQVKLNKMSEGELKSLKRQVRVSQISNSSDQTKLDELLDLEEKIDSTLKETPTRFVNEQNEMLKQTAMRIDRDPEISASENNINSVLKIANEIYSSFPNLQKSVDGKALALDLAAKHFKEVNKLSKSNTENTKLKGQVNTLKKKTSLDTRNLKGNVDRSKLDTLRNTAFKGGTSNDKTAYIKEDPRFKIEEMLPDFKIG